jgi:hypothetical protein
MAVDPLMRDRPKISGGALFLNPVDKIIYWSRLVIFFLLY